jgi:dCTP deaminase
MMLSDRDLAKLDLEEGIVEPFIAENCKGATINLTLDTHIKKYVATEPIILGREVTEDHYLNIDLTKEDFWLQPNESVLVKTFEFIRVPADMSARSYERYGVKSLGLQISPSHYMNPGWRGKITLVALNVSQVPIQLVPGVQICQIGFHQLTSISDKPYECQEGKYMDSIDVSISKLHLDEEIQRFLGTKGIGKVSDQFAKDLGGHLMGHIQQSAKRLAELLKEAEGKKPNE